MITALRANAGTLLEVTLLYGDPNEVLGGRPNTFSPLVLRGGDDVQVTAGYVGFPEEPVARTAMRSSCGLPRRWTTICTAWRSLRSDAATTGVTALRNQKGDAFQPHNPNADRDVIDFNLNLGAQVIAVVPQPVTRNVQSVSIPGVSPAGGDFTLTFRDKTTAAILANAAPAAVQAALEALDNLLPGEVVVSGLAGNWTVSFFGRYNYDNIPLLVADDAAVTVTALATLTQASNVILVHFNDDDLYNASVSTTGAAGDPTVVKPEFYQLILTRDTVRNSDDDVYRPTTISYDPVTDQAILTFADDLHKLLDRTGLAVGAATFRLRIGTNEAIPALPIPTTPVSDPGSGFGSAYSLVGSFNIGPVLQPAVVISQEIRNSTSSDPTYQLNAPGNEDEVGHRDIQSENHLLTGKYSADGGSSITTLYYHFNKTNPYGYLAGQALYNEISEAQKQRAREIFEMYANTMGLQAVETESSGNWIVTGTFDDQIVQQFGPSGPGGILGVGGPGRLVMDIADTWDDRYGGSWFGTAFHEIGHMIGLGHMYEMPPGTVMGSTSGLNFVGSEPVYPGDQDIVHGQMLHREESKDIDLYQFQVPAGVSGVLTAETIAERRANASNLDSVLRLYRQNADGSRTLLAQNDDYFSGDSYIELKLDGGAAGTTYFVGVSASGNDAYDPTIRDSGFGGRTEGGYDLKLNFRPAVQTSIVDTTGVALDGDADGLAGGVYDFWMKTAPPLAAAPSATVAETIYVDKSRLTTAINPGTIANPYSDIDDALAKAGPGDILRIVGNRGPDGLIATLNDNFAYEIGTNTLGNALSDGVTLNVPQAVTLMIDGDAIFKLRGARIGVGSSPTPVNRNGGDLQVLGVPGHTVIFTSYNDETIGFDTNPLITTPFAGDWGGLEFRRDVDDAEGRVSLERRGIFLNYVNHADLRYGGGQVSIDSETRVITPIHMSRTRPTVTENEIRYSADAAISADPDSFEETNFNTPPYQLSGALTLDYDRVGPEIHGNRLLNNSTNGLFVRVDTPAGGKLTPQTVQGRWDDTDIVHVVGENLNLRGTPTAAFVESLAPAVTLVSYTHSNTTGGSLSPAKTYNYRLVYVDAFGYEGVASLSTTTVSPTAGNNTLRLNNLPGVPTGGSFVGRRLYRSENGGAFILVGELDGKTATFTDNGTVLRGTLTAAATLQRPREDARLAIDPGTVVKVEGSKIEAEFGAQLIAEGRPGYDVVFTSRADDRYGASGTFDTNNDGLQSAPATSPRRAIGRASTVGRSAN